MSLTLAGTFDWCSASGWEPCTQQMGCSITSRPAIDDKEGSVMVRIESYLDVPLPKARSLVRPEAYNDQKAAQAYGYERTSVLHEYTPGDALVEYEWGLGTKCPLLFCVLVGRKLKQALVPQKPDPVIVRHALRSDFPSTGCTSWVVIPVKDHRLVDQVGLSPPATANWIEPQGAGIRQFRIFYLPTSTFHVVKHLLGMFCASVVNRALLDASAFAPDQCAFQLVQLKRCGSRPPLIPAGEDWEESSWDEFYLAAWLEHFARSCGLRVDAFDSFDGRLLPKRCAAVRRQQWDQAWPELDRLFKVQRQAYRHRYGGKDAPVLAVLDQPHATAALAPDPAGQGPDVVEDGSIVVKNTFIHFVQEAPESTRSA